MNLPILVLFSFCCIFTFIIEFAKMQGFEFICSKIFQELYSKPYRRRGHLPAHVYLSMLFQTLAPASVIWLKEKKTAKQLRYKNVA